MRVRHTRSFYAFVFELFALCVGGGEEKILLFLYPVCVGNGEICVEVFFAYVRESALHALPVLEIILDGELGVCLFVALLLVRYELVDGEHRVYVLFRRESYAVGIGLDNRCSALDGAEYTAVLRHSALEAEWHRHRDILYLFRLGNTRGVAESACQEYCGDYRRCTCGYCKLPKIFANRFQIPARYERVGKICREHDCGSQKRGESCAYGKDSCF